MRWLILTALLYSAATGESTTYDLSPFSENQWACTIVDMQESGCVDLGIGEQKWT